MRFKDKSVIITGGAGGFGSLVAINNALDGLVFRAAPGFAGEGSIQIAANDGGNTGSGGAAGNAGAILALNRLGRLVGETRFTAAADRCLQRAAARLKESPLAHAGLLPALQDAVRPPPHLVIGGTDGDAGASLKRWVETNYRVDCFLVGSPDQSLPGILAEYSSAEPVTAWLCRGMRCLPPMRTKAELEPLLG